MDLQFELVSLLKAIMGSIILFLSLKCLNRTQVSTSHLVTPIEINLLYMIDYERIDFSDFKRDCFHYRIICVGFV